MILISAGSGLAPFIGFLEERSKNPGGKIHVFFGCRNTSSYIYRENLEEFKNSGLITELNVAFSQENPKKYVQEW